MKESELRTKSDAYNAATAVTMGYQEIRNSAENWQAIMDAFGANRAKDLSDEPKKLLAPVILTGSGPSLDDSIEYLKQWKGAIICHYSQALTLRYYGIIPDYIVALDAICNWEGLDGVEWAGTKTKLVLHPGMWPSLVKNWPNELLFYRQNLGKPDSFGVNEQKIMFSKQVGGLEEALASKMAWEPLVKTELTMFACTPPAQLFVAQVLQYGPVYITGMDFSYRDGKERFTNFEQFNGEWVKKVHMLPDPDREYVITNTGFKTYPLHMYYLKNFISACRLSMQQVYTTDKGAVTQLPYISMPDLIAGKKPPKVSPEARLRTYERYLATLNCFVVNFERGSAFVEVTNPIQDMTAFMMTKNRIYKCQSCGAEGVSNDDVDRNGDVCTQCNKPKMARMNPCDVKANLTRIQALLAWVDETKEKPIA